ncbi:Guanine nucleotide-binding protein G(i) subunit alpha-like protein, partial [Reticulomyxa filosa]
KKYTYSFFFFFEKKNFAHCNQFFFFFLVTLLKNKNKMILYDMILEFELDKTKFKVVDVGGQRNERRKWIHFFDSVTAVLFVVSLSSYNEATFEDEELNSMQDSLQIFDEHLNSEWFQNTAFILFLNKNDVFEERLKETPISVCFSDYTGSQDYDECTKKFYGRECSLNYVRKQFESKNQRPNDREIYVHITQATDSANVKKVFHDVQHIVVNWSLQRC